MKTHTDLWETESIVAMLDQLGFPKNTSKIFTDPLGRIVWVDDAFVNATGYSLEEARGRKPGGLLHGNGTDRSAIKRMSRAMKSHSPCRERLINYTKSGSAFLADVEIRPVFSSANELIGFAGSSLSAPAPAPTRQPGRQGNPALADGGIAGQAIIIADARGVVRSCNRQAAALFGYEPEGIAGVLDLRALHDPDDLARLSTRPSAGTTAATIDHETYLACVTAAARKQDRVWLMRRSDGRCFPAALEWNLLSGSGPDIEGLAVTVNPRNGVGGTSAGTFNEIVAPLIPGTIFQLRMSPGGHFRIPCCNMRFRDMYGITPESVTDDAHAYFERVSEQDRARIIAEIHDSASSMRPWQSRYRLAESMSGQAPTWHEVKAVPQYAEEGDICWHGFIRDVTTSLAQAESLQRHQQLMLLLSETASSFIHLPLEKVGDVIQEALGKVASFLDVDRAYVFHHDPAAGATSNTYEWCGPEIAPMIDKLQQVPFSLFPEWIRLHDEGQDICYPDVASLPDSPMRDLLLLQDIKSLVTVPMPSPSRGCIGFIGFDSVKRNRNYTPQEIHLLHLFSRMLASIEERRVESENLANARQQIENFFDVAIDLHVVADLNGRFLRVSRAWEDLLGIDTESIHRKKIYEFIHPDDLEETKAAMSELGAGGQVMGFTNRYRGAGGDWRYLEWRSKMISNRVYASARDVTNSRRAQEALASALQSEREAAEVRENLISMASHEFRTPLASISLAAEMLDKIAGEKDARTSRLTKTILDSSDFLAEVVNDVLDYTAISHDQPSDRRMELDVQSWLRQVALAYSARHGTRNPLRLNIGPVPRVSTNPSLLKRALLNILDNAAKYSAAGCPVVLDASLLEEHLQLVVSDVGIGIPAAAIQSLYEPFFRAGNVGTIRGTGLGLSISREAILRLGGTIACASNQPTGSVFTIILPLQA